MAKDIPQAVREICLWFPEAEEFLSHGTPNFRVRGKSFAMFVLNHHGDGRVALYLNAPEGSQAQHTRIASRHFFIPPYVGPRGWLGVNLDSGLSWTRIAALVREAYEKTAPPALADRLGTTIEIEAPTEALAPEQVDRLQSAAAQKVVKRLRTICLDLPETSEGTQFGNPVWKAGKKTFAMVYDYGKGLTLGFWVGVERQGMYIADPRYSIPPYMGHNGWIALAVGSTPDWAEIAELARSSYRHFALKRMLAKLAPHDSSPLL